MEPKEHGENHHMPSTFRCRAALPDLTGVAGADFWGVLGVSCKADPPGVSVGWDRGVLPTL
jgi:hypothetical protein